MSFSVLTIVRNRTAHLENLIEGVRRSARKPDEIVIIDMSDEPIDLDHDPLVRTQRLVCEGLPLAKARNMAARCARSERLVFLDVDCIPMRECLGLLDQAVEAQDGLVCAEVRYLGPGDASGAWSEERLLDKGRPHPVRPFPEQGIEVVDNPGLFWSLAFAIRRATFFRLGGFDEAFEGYGAEDTDFGFAAKAAGLPLLFLGGAIACHQHHETFDPPVQHLTDIVRNAQRFRRKWSEWPMSGWLEEFRRMGLIDWSEESIAIRRAATPDEYEATRILR